MTKTKLLVLMKLYLFLVKDINIGFSSCSGQVTGIPPHPVGAPVDQLDQRQNAAAQE